MVRGVRRLLRASGLASVVELPLVSGRRADVVALAPDGSILIVEVKSSAADFRSDRKWPEYRLHCDRFYFAFPANLDAGMFPDDAGLIAADAYGAEYLREAPVHRISGAGRRALILRFGLAAADRLHNAVDPDALRF